MSINERIARIIKAEINSHSGAFDFSEVGVKQFNSSSFSADEILNIRSEIIDTISKNNREIEEIQSRYEKAKNELLIWKLEAEKTIKDPVLVQEELHKHSSYKTAVDLRIQVKEINRLLDSLKGNLSVLEKLLSNLET